MKAYFKRGEVMETIVEVEEEEKVCQLEERMKAYFKRGEVMETIVEVEEEETETDQDLMHLRLEMVGGEFVAVSHNGKWKRARILEVPPPPPQADQAAAGNASSPLSPQQKCTVLLVDH